MVFTKKFKIFDDTLLHHHPELKEVLKPNDNYPELKHILKSRLGNLPIGSINIKLIINDGEIVERVYRTPKGKIISLFSKSSIKLFDQAA